MATSKLSQQINEDFLTCSICQEKYSQMRPPKALQCLHTFCLPCLDEWIKKRPVGTRGLPCPTCRAETSITTQGAHLLLTNFAITQLQETLQNQHITEQTTYCDVCSDDNQLQISVVKCLQCREFLCEECKLAHRRVKNTRDHRLFSLEEISSGQYQAAVRASATIRCTSHPTENVEFYCEDDDAPICMKCTVIDHHGHQCSNLHDAAAKKKEMLREEVKLLEGKVNRFVEFINQQNETVAIVNSLVDNCNDAEIIALSQQTHDRIRFLLNKTLYTRPYISLLHEYSIPLVNDQLCTIVDSMREDILVDVWSAEEPETRMIVILGPNGVVKNKITRPNILGFTVLPDNTIAVSYGTEAVIDVYTTEGQFVRKFPGNITGSDLTVNSNNQLVVPYGNTVVTVYDMEGGIVKIIDDKTQSECKFFKYVTTKMNGDVIISDPNDHCIRAYDSHSQLLFRYGSEGDGEDQLKTPQGVCADRSGNVYIADLHNNRIQVISSEGQFKYPLLTEANGIKNPTDVCFNNKGQLVVVEYTGNVKIYTFQ